MSQRRSLSYKSEADVIADLGALRRGHVRVGQWTLEQIAWHLEATTRARMKPGPFPPDSPEQIAARPRFEEILRTGVLPSGLPVPDAFAPPAQVGPEAIDACVATLKTFSTYHGPFAPHRFFGHLNEPEAKKINLIHCANHLSWLVPTST